jgi:ribosome-binding factor A
VNRRLERIEDLLRAEISDLLRTGLRDPRIGLATVVRVEVSGDLRHARVLTSVLGSEEDRVRTVEALQHARGFIRSQLAARLRRIRVMPELTFQLDRGAEHSQRIHEILEELHEHDDDGA